MTGRIDQNAPMSEPATPAPSVIFRDRPYPVHGRRLAPGDAVPAIAMVAPDLSEVNLRDLLGKVLLISVVPSLDTGVCDAQTRRFNAEAGKLGAAVRVVTLSVDLPFAQKRWQTAADAHAITLLSDHRGLAFGEAAGLAIDTLRLLQRAILVADERGIIRYAEYVPNIGHHPDYDAAIGAARALAGD